MFMNKKDKNSEFRSILAYSCKRACPRALMYSTPDYKYKGRPIGSKKENCARLLKEKKAKVASFRTSVPNVAPSPLAPSTRLSQTPSEMYSAPPSLFPIVFCGDKYDEFYFANKRKEIIRYCRELTDMKDKKRRKQCRKAAKESKCAVSIVFLDLSELHFLLTATGAGKISGYMQR